MNYLKIAEIAHKCEMKAKEIEDYKDFFNACKILSSDCRKHMGDFKMKLINELVALNNQLIELI